MQKSTLTLEPYTHNNKEAFRATIKTQHGRILYLSIEINDTRCIITDCFYIDRNQGRTGPARYRSKPLKLQTFQFHIDDLLHVIETELDKKFYDVEIIKTDNYSLPLDQYLQVKSKFSHTKYHFLIMVGGGNTYNGLPVCLRTRLKNKLHRSIFVELSYYKDGKGVVSQCYYYDRKYKRQDIKITPPLLTSCFFPYTQEGILNLFNHEICCDFTHMIITDGIDLDSNTAPSVEQYKEVNNMANLAKEYTDQKNIRHNVEHLILSSDKKNSKEQIFEELLHALTGPHKHFLHKA